MELSMDIRIDTVFEEAENKICTLEARVKKRKKMGRPLGSSLRKGNPSHR
jgi:hypothetical protein